MRLSKMPASARAPLAGFAMAGPGETGVAAQSAQGVKTIAPVYGAGAHGSEEIPLKIAEIGTRVLRYGLALVVGWIGMMKFNGYEANGIQPLVAHSPLMGWLYHFLSVRQFSDGLGVVEVSVAILVGLRPWSPKASAIGSGIAVLMFLTTLSFLLSTPGWEPSLGGFPALSGAVGQFLLKDVVLLGAAIWSLGEALSAMAGNATRFTKSGANNHVGALE